MSDLRDLLQGVADSGELPTDKELKAVINRGYGGNNRPVLEEKQEIARKLRKYCYKIAERREYLDFETATEMVENGVEAFGEFSRGAEARLDPRELVANIDRHPGPVEPRPKVQELDTTSVQRILAKSALTDRPVPDAEIDRLDVAPGLSRAEVRKRLQEAADRVRELHRRGDVQEAAALAAKLGARIGHNVLDGRDPWPSDDPVVDNDPRALASMIPRESA
jgi:hypothetical protein